MVSSLMSAYGLRPEELQHLQLRQGHLWCLYEKVAARGKSKPRVLQLLPCDEWPDGWRVELRSSSAEAGPRLGAIEPQLVEQGPLEAAVAELRGLGQTLVPYSCRHGYAHRAQVICDLSPKVVATAMGQSVQTHLAAYSRWCGDDVVDDAFAKAELRLGQSPRVCSSGERSRILTASTWVRCWDSRGAVLKLQTIPNWPTSTAQKRKFTIG